MENQVINWIKQNKLIEAGDTVICATSGGYDSMAMLYMLNSLREKLKIKVCAAHFNHNIRGEESDRDEAFVKEFCSRNEIEFYCGSGDVLGRAKETGESVEEAARYLRYEFLENINPKAKVATAHHANDNLETVLIKMIRGTGADGISGIPPRRGNIIRPLLCVTRKQIIEYCEGLGLDHVEDSTNSCDDYVRNNIRHNIIPVMEAMNPNVAAQMVETCQDLREDNELIKKQADKEYEECKLSDDSFSLPALYLLEKPVITRVVRKYFIDRDVRTSRKNIDDIVKCIRSNNFDCELRLPSGYLAVKDGNSMEFMNTVDEKFNSISDYRINKREIECVDTIIKDGTVLMVDKQSVFGEAYIRFTEDGDKMRMPCGTKSLGEIFKNANVSKYDRKFYPVLCDSVGIIGIPGIGINMDRKASIGGSAIAFEVYSV